MSDYFKLPNDKSIYLVQRICVSSNPSKSGVDKHFGMDYMGSAEFEFGAMPASLKRIRSGVQYKPAQLKFHYQGPHLAAVPRNNLGYVETGKEFRFTYIGPEAWQRSVADFFQREANRKSNKLKEATRISLSYDLDDYYRARGPLNGCVGWWDIENDWVAFKNAKHSHLWLEGLAGK